MEDITHRTLKINGVRIHIAEQGSGPLILLLHGFPSLWYCWRHQIPFLAKAGYHVVAPDLRGYGQSDVPADLFQYSLLHIAGDVIGLIDALGEKQAFIAGHDWGSIVASAVALFRPDVVRGLVNISVPFFPRDPELNMMSAIERSHGERIYMKRWQSTEDGESEVDFAKQGMKVALAKLLLHPSREIPKSKSGKTLLESLELPDPMPAWLTDEDLEYYADNYNKTGITGALNYYRAMKISWELMSPWTGQGLKVGAALFITGDQDICTSMFPPGYGSSLAYKQLVPNVKDAIYLSGFAHFVMEEAPKQVNEHLLKFFKEN